MFNGFEKRTFQRLELPLEVTVEVIAGGNASKPQPLTRCRSRNVSKTGICLETKSLVLGGISLITGPPHARENRLLMRMELIPGEPPFCALGEVRWYDVWREETACIYQMGVEFVEIQDKGKSQLVRFLKLQKQGAVHPPKTL